MLCRRPLCQRQARDGYALCTEDLDDVIRCAYGIERPATPVERLRDSARRVETARRERIAEAAGKQRGAA